MSFNHRNHPPLLPRPEDEADGSLSLPPLPRSEDEDDGSVYLPTLAESKDEDDGSHSLPSPPCRDQRLMIIVIFLAPRLFYIFENFDESCWKKLLEKVVSAKYGPSMAQVLAKYGPSMDQVWAKYWPGMGQVWAKYGQGMGQV